MIAEIAVAAIFLADVDVVKKEAVDVSTNVVYIYHDTGGYMADYEHRVRYYRAARINVSIEGMCMSGCTMFIDLARDGLVCATDDAEFYFHQARVGDEIDIKNSNKLLSYYPDKLQEILKKRGFYKLRAGAWLKVKATDIIPRCRG